MKTYKEYEKIESQARIGRAVIDGMPDCTRMF